MAYTARKLGFLVAALCLGTVGSASADELEPTIAGDGPGASFLRAAHERVHRRWVDNFLKMAADRLPADHAVNDPTRQVVIDLAINPAGEISALVVEHPSGAGELDAAAAEVLGSSAPFPKPPALALSDDGLAHLRWVLARDHRRCGEVSVVQKESALPVAVPRLLAQGRDREAVRRVQKASLGRGSGTDLSSALESGLDVLAAAWLERATKSQDAPGAAAEAPRATPGKPSPATEKVAALVAAGRSGSPRAALFGLTPLLRDPSRDVRTAAAVGLVSVIGEPAMPQLYILFKETDPRPYDAVAAELARLSGPASAEVLGRMLRKSDRRIRLAGASALAGRRDEAALRALAPLARQSDPGLRFFAAAAVTRDGWGALADGAGDCGYQAFRALLKGPARGAAGVWLLARFGTLSAHARSEALGHWRATSREASAVTAAQ